MIFDRLENAAQYAGLHAGIDQVLAAVQEYRADGYRTGKVELDGERVYLNCAAYETHDPEGAASEAHREYIDVMYMVEGEETIYVKAASCLKNITAEYDPAMEALFADTDADATAVRLTAGSFVILFPQDAHTPGCWADGPCRVKKIIGKVRI